MINSDQLLAGFVGFAAALAGCALVHTASKPEPQSAPQFGTFDVKVQQALSTPVSNPRHAVTTYQAPYAIENVQPYDPQGALPWIDVPTGAQLTEINTVDDEGRVLSCYNAFGQPPVGKCANGVLIVVPAKVYDLSSK